MKARTLKGSPPSVETLVEEGYLRDVPYDPVTGEQEWGLVFDQEVDGLDPIAVDIVDESGEISGAGIIDVYSLSSDTSLDGTPYAEW